MILLGNNLIDAIYVGGKLVQQVYKGGKKIYPEHGTIPKAIKDSMVLWYDPGRQGATNDSMRVTPVLRDLSGNGHDATCYNFAWSGMSGIGGYYFYGLIFEADKKLNYDTTLDYNKVVILSTKIQSDEFYAYVRQVNIGTQYHYKIKVTGLDKFRETYSSAVIVNSNKSLYEHPITTDGVYDIEDTANYGYVTTCLVTNEEVPAGTEVGITIEQIPLYPNALVADGVDDYALCSTLPTLDDFTIVAKRKIFDSDDNFTVASSSDAVYKGCFVFESKRLEYPSEVIVFGTTNETVISNEDISYMTPTSYNGTTITKGTNNEGNNLHLFRIRPNDNRIMEGALYSFILFDRTLTTDEIEWVKKNMVEDNEENVDWYGVEFYTTSPYPDCIRIGNPELHRTLPVHSQMKGCLLSDEGTVNKYLDADDWTGEVRDGSQGQVMVEMPKDSYWKFETDGNIRRVKFSTKPLAGFKKTPQGYISAYEASLQRSTNKLSSVVNDTADYRGGDNNASWDDTYRSLLGKPATNINRTNFRTYARNRKAGSTEWNIMTYDFHKLLYWLFVVEYATLNSQKAFNSNKDINGFAQGGLGNGVTDLNGTNLSQFNNNRPFINCGYTDSLGNGTGQISYSMPEEYGATLTTNVIRYRGIENPFGHIDKRVDGINVIVNPVNDGNSNNVYLCSDPSKFSDEGIENYNYLCNSSRTQDYIKEIYFGNQGDIIAVKVGDGAAYNMYFCDFIYLNTTVSEVTLMDVSFGASPTNSQNAGLIFQRMSKSPNEIEANRGTRLTYIPSN